MSNVTVLTHKLWGQKIVRFVTIGCFNTLLDTSILLTVVKIFKLPDIVANTISASIAISVSYFLNHRIVFREPDNFSLKKYLHFLLLTGLGIILIQDGVIYLITSHWWKASSRTFDLLHVAVSAKTVELVAAKLVAVVCSMCWNFVLYKYVVFRHKPEDYEEELTVG